MASLASVAAGLAQCPALSTSATKNIEKKSIENEDKKFNYSYLYNHVCNINIDSQLSLFKRICKNNLPHSLSV